MLTEKHSENFQARRASSPGSTPATRAASASSARSAPPSEAQFGNLANGGVYAPPHGEKTNVLRYDGSVVARTYSDIRGDMRAYYWGDLGAAFSHFDGRPARYWLTDK